MEINNKVIVGIFRAVIIVSILFFYQRQKHVLDLVENQEPKPFQVIDKKCRQSHGGSYVDIKYLGDVHRIEYYGEKCFKTEVGGVVMLYYDEKNDFFYVPDSPIYERYIYGAILLFLLTFVPWQRMNQKLKNS